MAFSNAQILATILSKFGQPVIRQFLGLRLSQMSGYRIAEDSIKKWLPVSADYSLMNDLSFVIDGASERTIVPMLTKAFSGVPDDMIPVLAHGIVDSAIKQGELKMMDGTLKISKEDLTELKNYLNWNLPLNQEEEYKLITSDPKSDNQESNGSET